MAIPGEISLLSPLSSEQVIALKAAIPNEFQTPMVGDEKIPVPQVAEEIRNTIEILSSLQIHVLEHEIESELIGMSCTACAINIRDLLLQIPGVLSASINYATHQALIKFLPEMTEISAMQVAIAKGGYSFSIPNSENETESNTIKTVTPDANRWEWIPIIIAAILMTGGMFFMHAPWARVAMFILSTPVIFYFGASFFKHAFRLMRTGKSNMDTLVAMSTGIAWLFSTVNTFYPDLWTSRGLRAPIYFEAATSVIAFILLGRKLEDQARKKADAAVQALMQLQPSEALVRQTDGSFQLQNLSSIMPGQVLRCVRGESFAVDGKIVKGEGFIDESSLRGEPNPVFKKPGSHVLAGSINTDSVMEYVAESIGSQSALGKMIRSVRRAQATTQVTPLRRYMDTVTSYFVPAVFIIACLAAITWMYFGQLPQAIHVFISILIIACPCAMGLAIPTAIVNATGRGAREGIIIRNASGLEELRNIDVLVMDKTGTLTEGKPKVDQIYFREQDKKDTWLSYINALAANSNHPLSKAISEYISGSPLNLMDVKQIPGKGIEAKFGSNILRFGSVNFCMEGPLVNGNWVTNVQEDTAFSGHSMVCMKVDSTIEAVIMLRDVIRNSSRQTIQQLEKLGIEVWMLTGDHQSSAYTIAQEAGIRNFQADMLPEMKSDFIRMFQNKGYKVGMVGDGINDAGALAVSDVSLAMGQGADISIDVADMTLMNSNPEKIITALRLSRVTHRIIQQNLFWAFIYNLIAIPIAAGALYLINGMMLNPVLAGAAMSLSSLTVVFNSLRIRNIKLK